MNVKTLNTGDLMKNIIMAALLLGSISAHAGEILRAECVGKKGEQTRKLEIKAEVESKGQKNEVRWIEVDGDEQVNRDISQIPAYTTGGNANLKVQYGASLTNVATFSLKECNSKTEATGSATLNEGGRITELACGCSLK